MGFSLCWTCSTVVCSRRKGTTEGFLPENACATCPPCYVFEVYYAVHCSSAKQCNLCQQPLDRGVICGACSNVANKCHYCGIRANQEWDSLISAVVTKELEILAHMPITSEADQEFRDSLKEEWSLFFKVWQRLLKRKPKQSQILHMRGEYNLLKRFLVADKVMPSSA
mmetsp:Transcript_19785/g.34052  ORF Transcript_19785/g.34052 Transcript_19785/m.34052 type:complete len:168 (+) Transcript_19785:162-665(+)